MHAHRVAMQYAKEALSQQSMVQGTANQGAGNSGRISARLE